MRLTFDYPVTRKITSRYFAPIFITVALILTVFITLAAVVAVGYEYVPVLSTSFNSTLDMWYDRFMPKTSWAPQTRACQGSVMKVNEGLQTSPSSTFNHYLTNFVDPEENRIDGMIYSDNILQNCSVQSLELEQSISSGVKANVNPFRNRRAYSIGVPIV